MATKSTGANGITVEKEQRLSERSSSLVNIGCIMTAAMLASEEPRLRRLSLLG